MDKYKLYGEIRDEMIHATILSDTPEGRLIVDVIGQAIMDAMGLYESDKERVYKNKVEGKKSGGEYITRQDEAVKWFRDEGHYPFADMVEIEPSWITWLVKTKAGVEI